MIITVEITKNEIGEYSYDKISKYKEEDTLTTRWLRYLLKEYGSHLPLHQDLTKPIYFIDIDFPWDLEKKTKITDFVKFYKENYYVSEEILEKYL
jgi:hypothetical protein